MIKEKKSYIATVIRGIKRTLQAPGSDVSLDIPDGHRGVYVMGVHTNHSSVCHILDKKECFISPVVEVTFKSFETECNADDAEKSTINIPHCLDERSALQLIRVKRGDRSKSIPFHELQEAGNAEPGEDSYHLDEGFVRISTKTSSEFVCTTCDTTCQAGIRIFLLAKLDVSTRTGVSRVKVKPFLASNLFKISEYRKVSYVFNIKLNDKLS